MSSVSLRIFTHYFQAIGDSGSGPTVKSISLESADPVSTVSLLDFIAQISQNRVDGGHDIISQII